MRKRTIALVLVAVFGLLGASCGKSSSSHTGAQSATTAPAPTTATPAVVADLAPTGTLRLAVPAASPFLAHGNPPTGVGVALATALAARLGVPLITTIYPDPPAVLAAAHGPGWDVAVLPMLPATTAAVAFSAPVLLLPHTLVVRPGSSIQTLAQADQSGIRIASEATAPHTPVLAGQLHHATLVRVNDDTEALAMLKAGQVDAFADARLAVPKYQAQVPGSTVLAEDFFTIRFGMAIAKGHTPSLAWLASFVEQLKASGAVKQAIDSAQLTAVNVAPPGAPSP
jgi:polar amino acid transport system substrate-binding protein